MKRGAYIAIDGISGVGKTTLAAMIARQLQASQQPVLLVQSTDTPLDTTTQAITHILTDERYAKDSRTQVLLYNANQGRSLKPIRDAVQKGTICIADHSYLSTLTQQYYGRGDIADYNTANEIISYANGNLQPDVLLLLDAPVSSIIERLTNAQQKADLDQAYLERVRAGFLWEAKQRNLPVIYATTTVEAACAQAWEYIAQAIHAKTSTTPVVSSKAMAATKTPAIVAAAVPKTPQKPSQPSQPNQAEPSALAQTTKTTQLAEPVVTAPNTIAVSNLLLAQLPSASGIAWLETALSAVCYDQKDTADHYQYYVPYAIKGKVRSQYIRTMNQLFEAYAAAVNTLASHLQATTVTPRKSQTAEWRALQTARARTILHPLLPAAAIVPVTLHAAEPSAKQWAAQLAGHPLHEARQLLDSTPGRTESAASNGYQAVVAIMQQYLPANHTTNTETSVTLAHVSARNELAPLANMLYPYGDVPLKTLQSQIDAWPYQQKVAAFSAHLSYASLAKQNPRSSTYTFDVLSELRMVRNLQCRGLLPQVALQPLSPRLGYSTPAIIEEAGLGDTFDACFDTSLQLHSALQQAGHTLEAQYAVLLGHKVRWATTCNAPDVFITPQAPLTKLEQNLFASFQAVVAEVHPITAELLTPKAKPAEAAKITAS